MAGYTAESAEGQPTQAYWAADPPNQNAFYNNASAPPALEGRPPAYHAQSGAAQQQYADPVQQPAQATVVVEHPAQNASEIEEKARRRFEETFARNTVIEACVCFFCCWCSGLVSLLYQNSAHNAGRHQRDYVSAARLMDSAVCWAKVTFMLGLTLWFVNGVSS